jgi:hypothetical protein
MNPEHPAGPPVILGAVCAVLFRGTPPRDAVQELLAPDPGSKPKPSYSEDPNTKTATVTAIPMPTPRPAPMATPMLM